MMPNSNNRFSSIVACSVPATSPINGVPRGSVVKLPTPSDSSNDRKPADAYVRCSADGIMMSGYGCPDWPRPPDPKEITHAPTKLLPRLNGPNTGAWWYVPTTTRGTPENHIGGFACLRIRLNRDAKFTCPEDCVATPLNGGETTGKIIQNRSTCGVRGGRFCGGCPGRRDASPWGERWVRGDRVGRWPGGAGR
jgi:hypothetical protein